MHVPAMNFALVASLASSASAFWRVPCPSRLIQERVDPIISPGYVAAHVHTIAGGNGFGFNMSYDQAQASTCSSCPIKQDLSAYWTPKLYYQAKNGSFYGVPQAGDGTGATGGMTIYYLQRPGPNNDPLKAFPKGFRMVAGNPFKRNYTGDFAAQAVSFACLNYNGPATPETNGFPKVNCPDGLRAQVFFPSCWDGVNLDSADHTSHMAYPATGAYNTGTCPKSHPVHTISLFYEVIYQTNLFANEWYGTGQPFVFAQGDPTGYGMHGDFVNGWDISVLQNAINNCNADSGDMAACPYFNFFTDAQSRACALPSYINEDINGPMSALPGCNPVTPGPGLAPNGYSSCKRFSPITLNTSYFADVTSSLGYQYIGCGFDSLSSRTFQSANQATNAETVEMCVKFCKAGGYKYAGLEYATQCYCGNTLDSSRAPVPGVLGSCNMPCGGNSSQICGGPNLLSIYQKCVAGTSCSNNVYIPAGPKPLQQP